MTLTKSEQTGKMNLKLAVITDLHYSHIDNSALPRRKGHLADVLLERAVQRLNRAIKPDITVFLGDLLDDGAAADAQNLREQLCRIMLKLDSHLLVLPGNHDGNIDGFYQDFPEASPVTDIKGHRLLTFIDPEAPGYNAYRRSCDLEKMQTASKGFDGPVISLQHTSLFPPGASDCPYNYTNVAEVLVAMKNAGVNISMSGHYHDGAGIIRDQGMEYILAPALCESPFIFYEIDIEDGQAHLTPHRLKLPDNNNIIDYHVHTPYAYCSKGMSFEKSLELGEEFGLEQLVFTEHSGHLYFNSRDYWGGAYWEKGMASASKKDSRIADFLVSVRQFSPPAKIGLEVDACQWGKTLWNECDRSQVDIVIGALHTMPEVKKEVPDSKAAAQQFMEILGNFLQQDIDILAHPLRIFRKAGIYFEDELYLPTAQLLKKNDVAAEVNFHTNEPDSDFILTCIENGVKLAFGSDAHEPYEVGEFFYHLRMLENCGCLGRLDEILFTPVERSSI